MSQLSEALAELIETKAERDRERAKCDYEWGYLGFRIEQRLQEAEEGFFAALNDHIDARIEAARHQVKEEKA